VPTSKALRSRAVIFSSCYHSYLAGELRVGNPYLEGPEFIKVTQ
jgi:hypothetical protein